MAYWDLFFFFWYFLTFYTLLQLIKYFLHLYFAANTSVLSSEIVKAGLLLVSVFTFWFRLFHLTIGSEYVLGCSTYYVYQLLIDKECG